MTNDPSFLERAEFLRNLVDAIKNGGHADVAPGIHITGLLEDPYTEANIGLNQARFATDLTGLDIIMRFGVQGQEPSHFLVANKDFDQACLKPVDPQLCLSLLQEPVTYTMDHRTTVYSSINSIVAFDHELIDNANAAITTITLHRIEFADKTVIFTHNLMALDQLRVGPRQTPIFDLLST